MVTTSPISFAALPRVDGKSKANPPVTQGVVAPAIDREFAKVNTHAATWPAYFTLTRKTSILTVPAGGPIKYQTTGKYCDGLILGDMRIVTVYVVYTGKTLTADNYGGIDNVLLGNIADTQFRPGGGREISWSGEYSGGMCIGVLNSSGNVWLLGLSSSKATLVADDGIIFHLPYLVTGLA